jgi:hypothetical protein
MEHITEDQVNDLEVIEVSSTRLWSELDPEFAYFVVRKPLSARLAEVRQDPPVVTSALADGSARARRDERIAARLNTARPTVRAGQHRAAA